MDTQTSQNNSIPSATAPHQEPIFNDLIDTAPFEKSLKNARIWLYIVAALQIGVGIYEYTTVPDPDLALLAAIIDAGIGILFILFAIWSYKQPVVAFMTALITYVVINIGFMILEPSHIYKGIIMKVLVIVALVKAFNAAREVEKLRESMGN